MTTPLTVSIPHRLGRAEARRRVESGFARITAALPGAAGAGSHRWDGVRLAFSVAAMGQTIGGVVQVLDTAVTMEIELPGVFGLLAGAVRDRLRKAGQRLLER